MAHTILKIGSLVLLGWLLTLALPLRAASATDHGASVSSDTTFPPSLESYGDANVGSLWEVLKHRVEKEPFNLWATLLFLAAIVHTFFTHKFRHLSHVLEDRNKERIRQTGRTAEAKPYVDAKDDVSIPARIFHFLGEVEAVFGIWVVPLLVLMYLRVGVGPAKDYLAHKVNYQEPIFVVVIMAIAGTRPILRLAEKCLRLFARVGNGTPAAWWLSILTLGPLLGSFITEPAAMTIAALLLAKQFYVLKPRPRFAYATLGLLFVNISVGGTLTHFAAPPVLMVANSWKWDTAFMFTHFGWIAVIGILISNALYFFIFRKDFARLNPVGADENDVKHWNERDEPIPLWVTLTHVFFMAMAVINAHYTPLLIGWFLFFIAFYEVTEDYQAHFQLRSPVLVGFFLAGLVIHGGLQQWWIAPVLGRLSELPLMLSAIGLTAFNDNAAITYLSTLVPNLSEGMKYAVVAGAVTGGGLTVIANAPNPAGQSILNRHFPDGISPLGLLLGALAPTAIITLCFILLGG